MIAPDKVSEASNLALVHHRLNEHEEKLKKSEETLNLIHKISYNQERQLGEIRELRVDMKENMTQMDKRVRMVEDGLIALKHAPAEESYKETKAIRKQIRSAIIASAVTALVCSAIGAIIWLTSTMAGFYYYAAQYYS